MACFRVCLLRIGLLTVTVLLGFANTAMAQIVGSAYSVKTGELLYRETHQQINDSAYSVEYSEPNGEVFAHKTLDFSQSKITPSFLQLNERNGERIDVKQLGRQLTVNYLENRDAKEETESVALEGGMIVDAGFDEFVKQYWQALLTGKELDVDYLVPSKQTTFGFRVSKATCLDGTQNGALCFSLTPTSWLVKMAVDPIVVAYDSQDKRLLRFTGRANICDTKGKYEQVDIQYQYL